MVLWRSPGEKAKILDKIRIRKQVEKIKEMGNEAGAYIHCQ